MRIIAPKETPFFHFIVMWLLNASIRRMTKWPTSISILQLHTVTFRLASLPQTVAFVKQQLKLQTKCWMEILLAGRMGKARSKEVRWREKNTTMEIHSKEINSKKRNNKHLNTNTNCWCWWTVILSRVSYNFDACIYPPQYIHTTKSSPFIAWTTIFELSFGNEQIHREWNVEEVEEKKIPSDLRSSCAVLRFYERAFRLPTHSIRVHVFGPRVSVFVSRTLRPFLLWNRFKLKFLPQFRPVSLCVVITLT